MHIGSSSIQGDEWGMVAGIGAAVWPVGSGILHAAGVLAGWAVLAGVGVGLAAGIAFVLRMKRA